MIDLSEFESISPYTDAEAAEAISKLAEFPLLSQVSRQFFPEEDPDFLKNLLKQIKIVVDCLLTTIFLEKLLQDLLLDVLFLLVAKMPTFLWQTLCAL